MKIIFFTHPAFIQHQSMPRFARMLAEGMQQRGHKVSFLSPQPKAFNTPAPQFLKKWLGYIDQYIVFPRNIQSIIKATKKNTLFVFTDQALGPWVPLLANRSHVIHCHDFLAQHSAFGYIPENPTKWTGRQYQSMIRKGYSQGKNFISVSHKTRDDLHSLLTKIPSLSEVVYNGFNQNFIQQEPIGIRKNLTRQLDMNLNKGFILHVGGNQWYKNRLGVLEIYNAWRATYETDLPLLLVGEHPDDCLLKKHSHSPFQKDIHFLTGCSDTFVRKAYAGALVLLFPSLAEGFGWPIAEAMASGCPVITTNEAPMTEVAGNAGFYISRRPVNEASSLTWATQAAAVLQNVVTLSPENREETIAKGLENAKRFDSNAALDRIEEIYQSILVNEVVL